MALVLIEATVPANGIRRRQRYFTRAEAFYACAAAVRNTARASWKWAQCWNHNRGYMPIGSYPQRFQARAGWTSQPLLTVMGITS